MNLLESIHWLDMTLVAVCIASALIGAWRGVLRQTIRLITYVIAFYLTFYLQQPATDLLNTHFRAVAGEVNRLNTFLATFLATQPTKPGQARFAVRPAGVTR